MNTTEPRARRAPRQWQAGVSLIETLVALGLFAVTAGTMGNYLVQQIRMATSNYLYTQAYAMAEEELESTRALRYNDMAPGSRTEDIGGTRFTINRQLVADSPAAGLKSITVTVSWKDPQGPKNVVVKTIYTEVQRY
jgi:Tfp pilus assembly protein PilV